MADNVLLVGSSDRDLGLLYLKAIIEENTNYKAILSDTQENINKIAYEQWGYYLQSSVPKRIVIRNLNELKEFALDRKISKEIKQNNVEAVLVSVTSPYLALINNVCGKVKQKSDIPCIGGGPFFIEDEKLYNVLKASNIDAWCVGHASPIPPFLNDYQEGKLIFENNAFSGSTSQEEGMFLKTKEEIVGKGRGEFPYKNLKSFVVDGLEDSNLKVDFFGTSNCKNQCDYCSACKGGGEIPIAWWIDNMKKLAEKKNLKEVLINHYEENPLVPYNIKTTKKFWNSLINLGISPKLLNCYLDPSATYKTNNLRESLKEVTFEGSVFSVGRDTCSEETSKKLGRRYLGKIRDQEMLDREHSALTDFIQEVEGICAVYYILTPWETENSANALLEEWEELLAINNNIHISGFPLIPHFGTPIREKYRKSIRFNAPHNLDFGLSVTKEGIKEYDENVIKYFGKFYFK